MTPKNIIIFRLFGFILLFSVATIEKVEAQKRNAIWCFGDSAGIDFNIPNSPNTFSSGMDGIGSCASIADSNGNLIFYTNFNYNGDTEIWNSMHSPIANSDTLVGNGYFQGLVIVPVPDSDSLYYIFVLYLGDGIYYHLINMKYNGGQGIVLQKNVLLTSQRVGDCITAIKHGNGRDWWLIYKRSSGSSPNHFNRFYKRLITPIGISQPDSTDFNDATDADNQKIIWHPDFNKFMLQNVGSYMKEFSFNRCTGAFDTIRTIYEEQFGFYDRFFFQGDYSSNGNVFYTTTIKFGTIPFGYLLQFNLNDIDPSLTVDTVASYPFPPYDIGGLKRGPDNKIYFATRYASPFPISSYPYPDSMRNVINSNLGVINSPDSIGNSCDYQEFSFWLGGKRTYGGLPNNPDYDLGPLIGSGCDTLTVGITENVLYSNNIIVYYDGDWKTAFINAKNLRGKNFRFELFNMNGQLIKQESGKLISEFYTQNLDMSSFADNVYIVRLITEKEVLTVKFVKR
jgi:hypothetical protein